MGELARTVQGRQLEAAGAPGSLTEQMQYVQQVAGAGILPQAYKGRPADILVAIGLGQSMGLSPMESLYRIDVIQGKPTLSAELIAAQVRKAGHRLRIVKDEENLSVTATIIRADDPEAPFSVTRDQKWAERMGLAGKDNYRKQPLTMLKWRAVTAVAREACPEALYGVAYTADEMHDMDAPASPAPVSKARPRRRPDPVAAKRAEVRRRFDEMGYGPQQVADAITQVVGRTPSGWDDLTGEECDRLLADLKGAVRETNDKEDKR